MRRLPSEVWRDPEAYRAALRRYYEKKAGEGFVPTTGQSPTIQVQPHHEAVDALPSRNGQSFPSAFEPRKPARLSGWAARNLDGPSPRMRDNIGPALRAVRAGGRGRGFTGRAEDRVIIPVTKHSLAWYLGRAK